MNCWKSGVHEIRCYLHRNDIILNNLERRAAPRKVNVNWYKMEAGGGTEFRRLSVYGCGEKMCGTLWY